MGGFGRKLLLISAGMLLPGGPLAEPARAGDESAALALIGVETSDGGIEVVGSAVAVESGTFDGEMVIDRQGASGSVSTRQSRNLVLSAGERADIARVGVSYQAGDRLSVTVTLKRDGAIVSQATLSTAEK